MKKKILPRSSRYPRRFLGDALYNNVHMQTQITHSPSRWDSPLKTQGRYPRDRTCPREKRIGMAHEYTRVFNTVCPSVGWLNIRLTYGCVESRRLTRACETSTLLPFPFLFSLFLFLRFRYCETAFIRIIRQIRACRDLRKDLRYGRFTGQKESTELFKSIPSENLRVAKVHFTNVRSAWFNEFAARYWKCAKKKEGRIYGDITNLVRLQKNLDFCRTKNE